MKGTPQVTVVQRGLRRGLTGLLPVCLLVLSGLAAARDDGGSSPAVAGARLADYRDEYPTSALCDTDEITLWTCQTEARTYSLCSSPRINAGAGYIQYREGDDSQVEFAFPGHKRHPAGIFELNIGANGDAGVEFQVGKRGYTLVDRLRGRSSLWVAAGPDGQRVAEVACGNANQSLQLNYTIKLMQAAPAPTLVTLGNGDGPVVVPEGHVWKVSGLGPATTARGVGTADLYIDGGVQLGRNRAINLHGSFEFTLGGKQATPLWILAGATVGVGDSRGTLVVEDFRQR